METDTMHDQDMTPTVYQDQHAVHPLELTVEQYCWSEYQSLDEQLRRDLLSSRHSGYIWHSKANVKRACECTRAIEHAKRSGRNDIEDVFVQFLDELYHNDRADKACSYLPYTSRPVRSLTPQITIKRKRYDLQLMMFSFAQAEVPVEEYSTLALVIQHAAPDELYIGAYINKMNERAQSIICVKYGNWYVEIAEFYIAGQMPANGGS